MQKIKVLLRYINRFGIAFTVSFLVQRFILKKSIIKLNLDSLKRPIYLRNNYSDFQVFTQIFLNDEYLVDNLSSPKVIIDCGANIGLASLFFISRYPDSSIIALEPAAENYKMLSKNLGKYHNVSILNKALWSSKTFISIKDNGWGDAGFIVEECQQNITGCIETITLNDLVEQYELNEIDLLKMDIEGSEEQIFSGDYSSWLGQTNNMFVEIHENLKPGITDKILRITSTNYSVNTNGEYHIFSRISS
ncbi:FkbM family methyltransferase [Pontibacter sp. SGAir0037]|uniref:FkbM family methyltransferase n=1 Tax=Pontibacter sp. SGAir0037 TaxID=2571030 RepID=UPI0010CD5689|nr:FkbM family methyltransferase [Pontibacter sp. SGAir0037]QCR22164.1 hypothetical protein C1N53_07300 [Pontibacter sp. SGAir0037]